jgi:hypothetical protein
METALLASIQDPRAIGRCATLSQRYLLITSGAAPRLKPLLSRIEIIEPQRGSDDKMA